MKCARGNKRIQSFIFFPHSRSFLLILFLYLVYLFIDSLKAISATPVGELVLIPDLSV